MAFPYDRPIRLLGPRCPLWVKSRHSQYKTSCPLSPQKRTLDAVFRGHGQSKLELDMRLPLVKPASLTEQQKPLYEDMKQGIAVNFQGFANIGSDGALLGPWNPWLHEPKFGKPVWELVKTMVSKPSLPASVREVAILVTGAHFRSAYEIYAHVVLAENRGLDDDKLSTIVAGERPCNLTREEGIAYDVTSALVCGHVLPALTYKRAVDVFGESGAMELI